MQQQKVALLLCMQLTVAGSRRHCCLSLCLYIDSSYMGGLQTNKTVALKIIHPGDKEKVSAVAGQDAATGSRCCRATQQAFVWKQMRFLVPGCHATVQLGACRGCASMQGSAICIGAAVAYRIAR